MASDDNTETRRKIFEVAETAGCCERCAKRFTSEEIIEYNTDSCIANFEFSSDQDSENEQTRKKIKTSPCVTCLGILEDSMIEKMSSATFKDVEEYDSETFINFISLPLAVLIREHAMKIFMNKNFPQFFKECQVLPINKVWTSFIKNKIASIIGKKYDRNSNLTIQFNTIYEFEEQESSVMHKLTKKIDKCKGKENILSRNVVMEILKNIEDDLFCKNVKVPPEIPTKSLLVDSVSCYRQPIYIAGRYCKYSRFLGQTPWVVDNVQIVENSVQEIIFQSFLNMFNNEALTFSASGREDFDVRMLGRGRPFFIKISNPKITNISFEQFRNIEMEIKKLQIVKVRDLQFIEKNELSCIKDGEQFKKKIYRALCIIKKSENRQNYIDKINKMKSVKLYQKTPIRVFHRRSSCIRIKEIYNMKAKEVENYTNLITVDLVTQAGTYVKEFIHGDLGRTKPSLCTIIDGEIDIIALDVLDICLDFPPVIIPK